MRSWMVVLFALLLPVSASAEVVLCYGDSITRGDLIDPTNAYPAMLGALRPDLDIRNAGLPGDPSSNAPRFEAALLEHRPDRVLLLLGVNDPLCDPAVDTLCDPTPTPERTFRNLRRMAMTARRLGASVDVLTLTPAGFIFGAFCAQHPDAGGCPDAARNAANLRLRHAYAREVTRHLLRWRTPPRIRVLDLRDEFGPLDWSTLSKDGLHPNRKGHEIIAAFLAAALP